MSIEAFKIPFNSPQAIELLSEFKRLERLAAEIKEKRDALKDQVLTMLDGQDKLVIDKYEVKVKIVKQRRIGIKDAIEKLGQELTDELAKTYENLEIKVEILE